MLEGNVDESQHRTPVTCCAAFEAHLLPRVISHHSDVQANCCCLRTERDLSNLHVLHRNKRQKDQGTHHESSLSISHMAASSIHRLDYVKMNISHPHDKNKMTRVWTGHLTKNNGMNGICMTADTRACCAPQKPLHPCCNKRLQDLPP